MRTFSFLYVKSCFAFMAHRLLRFGVLLNKIEGRLQLRNCTRARIGCEISAYRL